MIRLNLRKLLDKLEKASGRKITFKQVAEQSGCDKNALSRLMNHPTIMPSTAVVDSLAQWLFHEFKKLEPKKKEEEVMKEVIQEFVSVFPDHPDYWESMPQHIRENCYQFPVELLWELHGDLKLPNTPRYATEESLKETAKIQAKLGKTMPKWATASKKKKK